MFSSFQVGATFTIINRASPVLEMLTRDVRALAAEARTAKVELASIGKGANIGGISRRLQTLTERLNSTAAASAEVRASMAADFDSIGAGLMIAAGNARALAASITEIATAQRALNREQVASNAVARGGGGGFGGTKLHGNVALPGGMGLRLGGPIGMAALAGTAAVAGGSMFAAEEQQSIMFALMGANINPGSARGKVLSAEMKREVEASTKGTIFSYQEGASILPALVNMALQPETGTGVSIEKILPLIRPVSMFAESESLFGKSIGRQWDLQESTVAAMQFAHLAGAYEPASLQKFLDVLMPVSMATERSPAELVTTAKYALPIANLMGFGQTDTTEMIGLLTALGATGSTAGTGLRQAMYGLLKEGPSASLANQLAQSLGVKAVGGSMQGSGRSKALHDLGFTDSSGKPTYMENGHPSFGRIIGIEQDFMKSHPGTDLVNKLSAVMSVRGAQIMAMLASGNAPMLWQAMQDKTQMFPGATSFQQMAAEGSTVQQWKQFIANSENLLNTLATSSGAVGALTETLKSTNGFLLRVIEFFGGGNSDTGEKSNFRKWLESPAPGTAWMHLHDRNVQNMVRPSLPLPLPASGLPHLFDLSPVGPSILHKEAYRPGEGGSGLTINMVFPGVTGDPRMIKDMMTKALADVLRNAQLGNLGAGSGTRQSAYDMGADT